MNERKKLTMQMSVFFLTIFVIFGTIIVKEKSNILFLPKIENAINNYITKNYNNLELEKEKINFRDNSFTMKVMNSKNKNHYFYITYSKKIITDTYKTDYLEGKTLLNHLNKVIEKKIHNKTKQTYTVKINNTYNNFSKKIQNRLINEENLESLKIYTLEKELTTSWEINSITKSITDIIATLEKENITPKNYTIIITDNNEITKSVKINNLTNEVIKTANLPIIINDIINNKQTSILSENKITYEYLN